ncbi:hypothetical protein B0T14DRAFT_431049 [Immersiella caudata]|uniref:Uncharacterized protein n=1 Tax=Immersiella caudata TaxID=314043 RepID=A0AA39WPD5_9PEZI|nr:hypothetical protein B0T14DRAFT_431049 [Immersiella caudata]
MARSPERKRQRRDSPVHSESDGFGAPERVLLTSTARWCTVSSTGHSDANLQHRVTWDEEKMKCFLSDEERNDAALMQGLLDGSSIEHASKLHPLIFDSASGPDSRALRSLPFFQRLASDDESARTEYKGWNFDKKRIVALGVRDLYLAAMTGLLDDDEKRLLAQLVDIVDKPSAGECAVIEGMTLRFHPSKTFKMVKFIEDLDAKLDSKWGPYFAQVLDAPRLYAVFVDPVELSFHNFENIVPLDQWMETKLSTEPELSLELADVQNAQPGPDVWTAKLQGSITPLLKELSALDLFVVPLNKGARGGERFIFHSTILSKAFTEAISSSGILPRLSDGKLSPSDFAFANYVFRCNRFAPGDAKFSAHRDIPYYDAARSQVSKYTLLVYLSSGTNPNGALEVNGTTLTDIDEFTCVIFDQRHEHEGRSFVDTDKVFLRTELVFNDRELDTNPKIAPLFSEACYMAGQSIFDEELASYAHQCFERANSLHWAVEKNASEPPAYLYKQYLGFKFLTNGYDYWFVTKSQNGSGAADCAIVAVLDYLNCKIGNQGPLRALCRSTTIRETITSHCSAFQLLSSPESTPDDKSQPTTLPRLSEQTIESLFKQSTPTPFTPRPHPSWVEPDEEDSEPEDGCCPMHCWTTFNAWNNDDVAKEYRACCKFTTKQLLSTPIIFLGEEILLNDKQVEIRGDKILIHTFEGRESTRFNFAACWGDAAVGAELYVDVDQEIPAPKLLVPPIVFREYEGEGYHLRMDFFRNDWMVRVDEERKVPVPVVTNEVPEDGGEEDEGGPFWKRVRELAGSEELGGSFWERESDEEEDGDEDGDEEED